MARTSNKTYESLVNKYREHFLTETQIENDRLFRHYFKQYLTSKINPAKIDFYDNQVIITEEVYTNWFAGNKPHKFRGVEMTKNFYYDVDLGVEKIAKLFKKDQEELRMAVRKIMEDY